MKQRLSSSWTLGYRLVIPALLSIGSLFLIWRYTTLDGEGHGFDLALTILAVSACVFLARLLDRAKWVWLTDEHLILSDKRQEISLALADIKDVSATPFFKPDRIKVTFNKATVFGDSIVFFPRTMLFNSPKKNPTLTTLTASLPTSQTP